MLCQPCLKVIKSDSLACCPDPECVSDAGFTVIPFSSVILKRRMGAVTVQHKCAEKIVNMSLTDLLDHCIQSCIKVSTICHLCGTEPDDKALHLKTECPFVEFDCNFCEKRLTRAEFKEHECFQSTKNIRELAANLVVDHK